MDAFIARANVARMRLQLATPVDAETRATLQQLLEEQLETLRVGEAGKIQSQTKSRRLESGISVSGEKRTTRRRGHRRSSLIG
jgi:hypothetical protein